MLISVHMPKTAGNSFLSGLTQRFGERLLQVYFLRPISSSAEDRINRAKYRCKLFFTGRDITKRYDAIHGHFTADTFNRIPGPKQYCMFLREPADRTISHYLFWLEQDALLTREGLPKPYNSVRRKFLKNRLGLNEFAELPEMVNFFSIYLGKMRIEDFDFIGLQEEYSTSLRLFERIFGLKIEESHENPTSKASRADLLSRIDLGRLRTAQSANQLIYDQARKRFDQLCARYL
ncbi:MAG: hypothetical protein ABFD97_24050 [Syntrophobacter sp.]